MFAPTGRLLPLLFALMSCRPQVPPPRPPAVALVSVAPPPVAKATPEAARDPAPGTGVFDLRVARSAAGPITANGPAWPQDPAPIVDVVIRVFGQVDDERQDVEVVARIGLVSRRIMTRVTGSTRMGLLCPDSPSVSGPDDHLPKGEVVAFSPNGKEASVSWIGFWSGGATNLVVARASADTLIVREDEHPDGLCDDPSGCSSTRTLAVIPIPPSAKTRGRVVEVAGDGDIPFRLCPAP